MLVVCHTSIPPSSCGYYSDIMVSIATRLMNFQTHQNQFLLIQLLFFLKQEMKLLGTLPARRLRRLALTNRICEMTHRFPVFFYFLIYTTNCFAVLYYLIHPTLISISYHLFHNINYIHCFNYFFSFC